MKNSKRFFCGIAILALAAGAGVYALSQNGSGFLRAEAAVTDVEPASELHLDQTKIKNVSIQYETMTGHNGNEVTAYVASASGLASGKNAEYRFVTEGTEGNTKVAYSKAVESVRFWYKLTNSSERNVADGAFPYLLQVLDSEGTYPLRSWTPNVDGEWHQQTMDVGSDFYNRFAGFVVKAGDLNGSITVADIQLITTAEQAGELHVVPTKVQRVSYHFEWLTGHSGNKVAAYVFEGDGGLYPQQGVSDYMPEMRFVNADSDASTKIPCATPVLNVHFWYKITNTADLATHYSQNGTDPYCIQVVKASGYPEYDFHPVADGEWHQFTLDVAASEQSDFVGIIVQAGDLKGTIVLSEIELNKYNSTEPTSDLHLDQVKIRRVSVHYEQMTGPDGNPVNAYVAEGAGGLYPVQGNSYMPEVRFMNADSGDSVKVPFAEPVANIHFWYKLDNKADVETHNSEIAGEGYCLQGVTTSGYPMYNFSPINDGEWHSWLLEFNSADQNILAGFIVQAGDLDGTLVIANLEVNGNYKQLSDVITFKEASFNYDYIDNYFANFNLLEDVFNYDSAAYTGHYQDHASEFLTACEADIMNTIAINGKTLQYWKTFTDSYLTYPRTAGVTVDPLSHGGQYSPVSVEFKKAQVDFKFVLEYFPMTSIEVTFLNSFKSVSGGVTYESNNDLTFKATILASADKAKHSKITFQTDLSHELSREFHITNVDLWATGTPQKYQRFVLWTDVPRDTVKADQAWPHDNYRYMFDDILLDGVSLTHYCSWARGNCLDFDADWNVNADYVTDTPVAGARNYNTAIQPHIVTDQPNYVFFIDVPLKIYEDLNVDWFSTFSIRKDALWVTTDGPTRNSATATFNKITSKTEAEITELSVSETANGTGMIELHTNKDMHALGYNFSDKAWEDCCLDMIKLNYQSLRQINANPGVEISQVEYNIEYFNAYGVTDGAAKPSRLTVPVIVHVNASAIRIIVHPKLWAQMKTEIIYVNVAKNTRCLSDGFAYFNIGTAFMANTDDFFLNQLVGEGLHMSDYDASLTGVGDGSCKTYYAGAKAKFQALTSTAKNRFLTANEFADARERMARWAELNNETFNVSTGEFSRTETFNPFTKALGQDYSVIIVIAATAATMLAVGAIFFFIKKRRG